MFKFSYVQSVAGKAKVVDKDTFKKIITDTRVKAICNQIASTADTDAISRLKRGLPAFCWHTVQQMLCTCCISQYIWCSSLWCYIQGYRSLLP